MNRRNFNIAYISDLHLDGNVGQNFLDAAANPQAVQRYLQGLIDRLLRRDGSGNALNDVLDFIIVDGDVAHDLTLTKLFYSLLAPAARPARIIAILGNHELWREVPADQKMADQTATRLNFPPNADLAQIVDIYRRFFAEKDTIFLQNALYAPRAAERIGKEAADLTSQTPPARADLLSADQLLQMSAAELRTYAEPAELLVFGGLGFSGCEPFYNAALGLYQSTITLAEDQQQSALVEALYEHLRLALADLPLLMITHTPPTKWSYQPVYCPNWRYVWGHTHSNEYEYSPRRKVFADNQVGHQAEPQMLKTLQLPRRY